MSASARRPRWQTFLLTLLLAALPLATAADDTPGEQIYRKGLLPSGKPLMALVQGDITVDSTMFSCSSCHLRSGLGSFEGGVYTPPTNGEKLYQPYDLRNDPPEFVKFRKIVISLLSRDQHIPQRPAYTDATLAKALRDGIDPAGRSFTPVMPRYLLDDSDMALLIAYLKRLSSTTEPGVSDTALRFATVITEDVSQKERSEMLAVLQNFVRGRSNPQFDANNMKRRGMRAKVKDPAFRTWSLVTWELKGPPATWRQQLEEYYRKEPVFALLGGISGGEWQPVHDFCETQHLPCFFPITDLPVISATDWYTLYFSKGYYQEGEAAARHLARQYDESAMPPVVQVYADTPAGRAFAAGFRDVCTELGRPLPAEEKLPADGSVDAGLIRRLAAPGKPLVLAVWQGGEIVRALEEGLARSDTPATVYLSASLLRERLLQIAKPLRPQVFLTYPYRFTPAPEDAPPETGMAKRRPLPPEITDRRVAAKMTTLGSLLATMLMDMRGNYYRDYLLDAVSMGDMMIESPYEQLTFGPGQRYAAKGCYVVQLSPDDPPHLDRKSEWVGY